MVKTYQDPKQFWSEVSPHLRKEEAKNSLCLGLAYAFRQDGKNCLYQSALFDGGKFLGSTLVSVYHINNHFLPSGGTSKEAAAELFEAFKASDIYIHGLVGELDTAMTYKKMFENLGRKSRVHMTQGIYRCRKVVPAQDVGVKFRVMESKDVPLIAAWMSAFHKEAVPHDPPSDWVKMAEGKLKGGTLFVVEKDGAPVSMAAVSRDLESSCSVNFVFTPRELRGKGYASAVTAMLTQSLLEKGKSETVLYTDMANPTSNKIYQNIGYEFVCDSIHYGFL